MGFQTQQFSFQQQQGSVRSNLQGSVRGQAPDTQMQTHLPGEPDCTLELVEVPSVRGIKGWWFCFAQNHH
jgi:hypothetical protein